MVQPSPQTSDNDLQFCGSCKQELPMEAFSPGNRGKRGTWCRPCFAAYNKGRRPHVQHDPIRCDHCGAEFVPKQVKPGQRRYCSSACKSAANWERTHPRPQRACPICGADVTDRRRDIVYCSRACASEQRRRDGRRAAASRRHRLTRYGLTEEAFDALLATQGGGCAICGSPDPRTHHGRWHVDHDHACCPSSSDKPTCGQCVRGLLCGPCNTGLGHFEDDPDRLESAARYLRKP